MKAYVLRGSYFHNSNRSLYLRQTTVKAAQETVEDIFFTATSLAVNEVGRTVRVNTLA